MKLGNWGEIVAEKYIKKKGYIVIEKNYSCKIGEIDIIALNYEELVFLEVKTRSNMKYGLPCEAVNKEKIRHIKRMAELYVSKNSLEEKSIRFDVIEVLKIDEKTYIHHIENAIW